MVYTLKTNKKWDPDSTMLGQKEQYRCSLSVLVLKWRHFSIIRLPSDFTTGKP